MKDMSYFCWRIMGTTMEPMAATSAMPNPEMAPNSIHETTKTMASPPGMRPTRMEASRMILGVMSPRAISVPASRKSGMARSVKESTPTTMRCAMAAMGTDSKSVRYVTPETAMAKATGIPIAISTSMEPRSSVMTGSPHPASPSP